MCVCVVSLMRCLFLVSHLVIFNLPCFRCTHLLAFCILINLFFAYFLESTLGFVVMKCVLNLPLHYLNLL